MKLNEDEMWKLKTFSFILTNEKKEKFSYSRTVKTLAKKPLQIIELSSNWMTQFIPEYVLL